MVAVKSDITLGGILKVFKNAACAPVVRASVTAVLGSTAILLWSSALIAAEEKSTDEELAAVQVTGTRIAQRPGYTTPNPVNTITGDDLRKLGIVNVADALTSIVPQNISTYQQATVAMGNASLDGRGALFVGMTIANLRGLDPTYGSRTLTLIDGKRVVSSSNQADVVDLNIIPSNLLERADVVTGGGSAAYGSGAMAGVVNLVLNNRLQGVNLDMDYGVNEAGDGGNKHIAVSGGTKFADGKGHVLLGLEWQDQNPIRNCATARDWCGESRYLYSQAFIQSFGLTPTSTFTPDPGFENYPAHFGVEGMRLAQYAPAGGIIDLRGASSLSGYKFTDSGTDVYEYAYGLGGGTPGHDFSGGILNGDGPPTTSSVQLTPSTNRRTAFANFDWDFSDRVNGYLQANYAKTGGDTYNTYTRSYECVHFNTQAAPASPSASAQAGVPAVFYDLVSGAYLNPDLWKNAGWLALLGNISPPGSLADFSIFTAPYWYGPGSAPTATLGGQTHRYFTFPAAGDPVYTSNGGTIPYNQFLVGWSVLVSVTPSQNFTGAPIPAQAPGFGRNDNAYLHAFTTASGQTWAGLSPEAIKQLQLAAEQQPNGATKAGNYPTGTDVAALSYLVGAAGATNTCQGQAALFKFWNTQLRQSSANDSETARGVLGAKGRFGDSWRWESYFSYGQTKSSSTQTNAATSIRKYFASDPVIDDRTTVTIDGVTQGNLITDILPDGSHGTYGTPVCRIVRDGGDQLSFWTSKPTSDPQGLVSLVKGCRPLNPFGSVYTGELLADQQAAIAYAYRPQFSSGKTTQSDLAFNTNGELWKGWAGPLTGAFGVELRQDQLDNSGIEGSLIERTDFNITFSDAFGGKTRVGEAYTELNMPLISGMDGINQLSIDGAVRYAKYNDKGAAGTNGDSLTQSITNWKFSSVFEPFEWVRFRFTQSRDLRAAGYRDLFLNQPGQIDSSGGSGNDNPWLPYVSGSTTARTDRYTVNSVGNPNLKPEKSDTTTIGLVLSPGGWASGMRLSADYYAIKVADGITQAFFGTSPIQACWQASKNANGVPNHDPASSDDPNTPYDDTVAVNGNFDPTLAACQRLVFGTDQTGARDLTNIVAYTRAPTNGDPFYRKGVDLAVDYSFPLNRVFESVPGSVQFRLDGTRALQSAGSEATGDFFGTGTLVQPALTDLVGQFRNATFIPGVSATPKWTGNARVSYLTGDLAATLSARYIGGGKIDKTWSDNPGDPNYQNAAGAFLFGSVDNNHVNPYFNFSLNGSYNLHVSGVKQFQVFGTINNLFDKEPPVVGGSTFGSLSGTDSQWYDVLGRAYRMGVRVRF